MLEIPQVSFWALRVFGRLPRLFVRCNRVSDDTPENAGKIRFFSKSVDRRTNKCVDPNCVVLKGYSRGVLT